MATALALATHAPSYLPGYLGQPEGLNYDALNVLLRTGFLCGTQTPFAGVEVTPPPLPTRLRAMTLSRTAVIDGYISLFRSAVARCIDQSHGPVCMGLSGGRDSRHILLELCRQGAPPDLCWTANVHEDVAYAQQLAKQLRVSHVTFPPSTSIHDEEEKNRRVAFSATEHVWAMANESFTENYETVYDGIGGDVLSAGLFLTKESVQLIESGKTWEYASSLVGTGLCLNERLMPRDRAVEVVRDELLRYMHLPNPLRAFWFFNRMRRTIAMSAMHIMARGKTLMTPFLDFPLVQFLLSIPASVTVDHSLHTDTIAKAYPHCRVAYGTNRELTRSRIRRECATAFRYILRKTTEPLMNRREVIPRLAATIASPRCRNYAYLARRAIYCAQILGPDARLFAKGGRQIHLPQTGNREPMRALTLPAGDIAV